MKNTVYESKSDEDTRKFGEEFAKNLKPGDTVYLYGDLGFGKTTFVKGVAKGLGINSRIISPTFVIVRSHKIEHPKSNIQNLVHVDLYRIENKKQLEEIGIDEMISDTFSIKLVEWPEKGRDMGKPQWEVRFVMNKDTARTINIYEYK